MNVVVVASAAIEITCRKDQSGKRRAGRPAFDSYLESLLHVKVEFSGGFHVSNILHGLADHLAGELLFNLAIVFLVALVSNNHYWHLDSIAA